MAVRAARQVVRRPVVIPKPEQGRVLWRVGYHGDPFGFTVLEFYECGHRVDDIQRRFRCSVARSGGEVLRAVLATEVSTGQQHPCYARSVVMHEISRRDNYDAASAHRSMPWKRHPRLDH